MERHKAGIERPERRREGIKGKPFSWTFSLEVKIKSEGFYALPF